LSSTTEPKLNYRQQVFSSLVAENRNLLSIFLLFLRIFFHGFCLFESFEIIRPDVASIYSFTGYDVPDTAFGVGNIIHPSWDEMDMAVPDGLSGSRTDIHSDIESVDGSIDFFDVPLRFFQQTVAGKQLFIGEFEITGHMTLGYDERVEFRYRKAIPDRICEFVFR